MANKSYIKRIRVSPTGKLLIRNPGGNHFNANERRQKQLDRKRTGAELVLTPKKIGRHLKG